MPKIKTVRGAAKRFRLTSSGKIRRNKSHHSHLLTKKSTKRKRNLRKGDHVNQKDAKRIRRMLAV